MAANTDLQTCFDTLREAGYRCMDFWLCKYCVGEDAPLAKKDWRQWVRDAAECAAESGLRVGQMHAHWDHPHQIHEDMTYDAPLDIHCQNIEAAAMMGCRRLIFHPIQRWFRMTDPAMRQQVLDINADWFSKLLPAAEQYGVELHLENLFDHKHVQQPGDPVFPFSTAEDLLYVVQKLNHPLVKICLDTGHANINSLDVPQMIRAFGRLLGSLHLNDNYGKIGPIYEDLHLFPGYGRLPWPQIMAALDEIGYADTLNMEPGGELKNLPRPLRAIQYRAALEMVETMQQLYCQL